jgi:small GTP-binding protein
MLGLNELTCKILVLGESKVGKSSILNQFTENIFSENLPPTLGIDYKIKKIQVDNIAVKLQIWDTAGQERFRSITESFYKGCNGVLLVFDLSDRDTFKKIKLWIESIHLKAGEDVVITLVGNKVDLKNSDGVELISDTEVVNFSKDYGLEYFPVSAKENINIHKAFEYLAKEIKKKFLFKQNEQGLDLEENKKNGKKCC